ncbi:gp045 [Rhodococcus phage ReqiPoco6]|uniref:Gp045 n=1 Tax=Rhodococcus phage ReqiPoco6 TaxID=691964 RepID=D4P7R3_9CAUD|nr:gp045 [Rhodococcus phage ReqiPoco6]ADD81043.1 gp045 [Rhodococcus phage ReqiPoco6]
MNNKIAIAALAVGALAVAGIATINCLQITREEEAKRAEFKRNEELNVHAVTLAAMRISERLEAGDHFASVNDLTDNFNEEIKFQKIAVRFDS